MTPIIDIDVSENKLRARDGLLEILLIDHSTQRNILWGTDSYERYGKEFAQQKRIKAKLITGVYGKLIQPRAVKSREEQQRRTRGKGEVFTPLRIVHEMNSTIDRTSGDNRVSSHTWQDYVCELKLEITCGEAPFIVSRYNPTASTHHLIKLENRVGFLDHKLRVVSHYCNKPKQWVEWAKVAFQSSYGYEWQGDNLLIARENLFYSLIDYYKAKFNRTPSVAIQEEFAHIISWNIFQMDGTRYVVPMSCHHETKIVPGELTLFGETPETTEKYKCEGCEFNQLAKHNGKYVKIMDWSTGKPIKFVSLVGQTQEHLIF